MGIGTNNPDSTLDVRGGSIVTSRDVFKQSPDNTGACPAGSAHVDSNSNSAIDNGECHRTTNNAEGVVAIGYNANQNEG